MYYKRNGEKYKGVIEWAKDFETMNRVVMQETLKNGHYVSTVYLGVDHSYNGAKPLIFETMVFPRKGKFRELDCERYSTEKQALKGHQEMVKKWEKK